MEEDFIGSQGPRWTAAYRRKKKKKKKLFEMYLNKFHGVVAKFTSSSPFCFSISKLFRCFFFCDILQILHYNSSRYVTTWESNLALKRKFRERV